MDELSFPAAGNHGVFFLPNTVVDSFLREADGDDLKILLFIMRHGEGFTKEGIMAELELPFEKLSKAVAFWAEKGVLSFTGGAVSFNPGSINPSSLGFAAAKTSGKPPEYDFDEISAAIDESPRLKDLIAAVQPCFSRPLSQSAVKSLYSFYDFYGFPPEVIFRLVCYCADLGKDNMRYIEQVAHDWYRKGINTEERAARYIEEAARRHCAEYMVKRVFGVEQRSLTTREKKLIQKWAESFGFGEDIITAAYERCADATSKLSFSYIDKILTSWAENSVKTAEDIAALEEKHSKRPREGGKKKGVEPAYNIEEFEKWSFNQLYSKDKGGEE